MPCIVRLHSPVLAQCVKLILVNIHYFTYSEVVLLTIFFEVQ